jgi:phosphohistidine swiveling domain-containing protein
MRPRRLLPLGAAPGSAAGGAKAARLSAALRGGFPVLPGWVVPCAESRPAVRAAAAELRAGRPAAGRRAALSHPPGPVLAAELREAVNGLGGRVIVRSSSPLESDPCWSGAFSSLAEVGQAEVVTAVRSCWASAFAVDPLARLDACGLAPEALETGVLIQPEIGPDFGGVARVLPTAREGLAPRAMLGSGSGVEVAVEGVPGHPGALLSGWADGASARVSLPAGEGGAPSARRGPGRPAAEGPLADLAGSDLVLAVARLAEGVHRLLGDDTIEWAACGRDLWLLQSGLGVGHTVRDDSGTHGGELGRGPGPGPDRADDGGPGALEWHLAAREWMPALGARVQERGRHLRGRPAVAGQAAGRLVVCRPHEPAPATCRDAVLLVDRPLPALAPLLFTARGVIARSGAAGSHLAGVARSLAVPMVTGCHPEIVTGGHPPGTPWLAAIDGGTGDVALFPEREDRHA